MQTPTRTETSFGSNHALRRTAPVSQAGCTRRFRSQPPFRRRRDSPPPSLGSGSLRVGSRPTVNVRFLIPLFCAAFFIPTVLARDGLEDYEAAAVSPRIESIVMGGLWHRADLNGECRLVVTRYGYAENTSNEFFIQWLRTENAGEGEVVYYSTRIPELNGYCVSDGPRHLATNAPDFGQSFELTANPRGVYLDEVFTITPRADFTYAIASRPLIFAFRRSIPIAAAFFGGIALGVLLAYAKLRK